MQKFRVIVQGTEPLLDERGLPLFREAPVLDAETGLPIEGEPKRVNLIAPVMLRHKLQSRASDGQMRTLTLSGSYGHEFELGDIACELHAEALCAVIAEGLIERVT